MQEPFQIRPLLASDVSDNVDLARAVGWHDVESDWRVLHEAAYVIGMRSEGRLVAQGALGSYGSAGTIAKMIVAPEYQRRGAGARILEALLNEATARSIAVLGLVAKPFGQPLYERYSFARVGEVVVMTGTPNSVEALAQTPRLDTAETAIRVEERWIGRLRARMLRARFREACATAATADANGAPSGYAMATLQGPHVLVGPVVAEDEDEARGLAHTVFDAVACPVRIDVPAEQVSFRTWLRALGLREQAVRPEMARSTSRLPWQIAQRFALATQAWG